MKSIIISNDGSKNCTLQITISGPEADGPLIRCNNLSGLPPPTRLRVDCITYAISEGAEIVLSWNDAAGVAVPFLALSGRGRLDYDHAGGLGQLVYGANPGIDLQLLRMSDASVVSLVLECEKC